MNHLHFTLSWWSLTASEVLLYGLNFKIFLEEQAPRPPTTLCAICVQTNVHHTHHMHHTNPHSVYTPPSSFSGSTPGLYELFEILRMSGYVIEFDQAEWSHSHICQVHEYITFINLVNKIVTVLIN